MAIPVPQLDTFTAFHIIVTAIAHVPSCTILFISYSSGDVAARKRWREFNPSMNQRIQLRVLHLLFGFMGSNLSFAAT
jgi:hypothetical protein